MAAAGTHLETQGWRTEFVIPCRTRGCGFVYVCQWVASYYVPRTCEMYAPALPGDLVRAALLGRTTALSSGGAAEAMNPGKPSCSRRLLQRMVRRAFVTVSAPPAWPS